MNAPTLARILGSLFFVAGIAGFLPWTAVAAPPDAPVISLDVLYRFIGGVLPVNAAVDALYLIFGVWGAIAAIRFGSAVAYCRIVTWFYLPLVVLGALPVFAFYTLFGAAPIFGWDVALHASHCCRCRVWRLRSCFDTPRSYAAIGSRSLQPPSRIFSAVSAARALHAMIHATGTLKSAR